MEKDKHSVIISMAEYEKFCSLEKLILDKKDITDEAIDFIFKRILKVLDEYLKNYLSEMEDLSKPLRRHSATQELIFRAVNLHIENIRNQIEQFNCDARDTLLDKFLEEGQWK